VERTEKELSKPGKGSFLYVLFFSVLLSVVSGMASGWYFSGKNETEIVVLDVAKIVDGKKKEFIEKYRDRGIDPGAKDEMGREISMFTDRLNRIIKEEESRGRIILVRDSVISEIRDITNEVEDKIKSSH